MSADNAVIIASFPTTSGGAEYRVAEAGAIDNLSYYTTTEQQDAIRATYFENAIPFFDYEMALKYARELAEDCDILEYGVLSFEFDRPLVHMTSEQIEAILYPQDEQASPDPDLDFVPCPFCGEEYCPTSDTCLTKAISMLKQVRGALLSARDCIAFDGSLDEENDILIANKALDEIDAALDAIPNTIPGWTGTTCGSIMPDDGEDKC